MGSFGSRSSIGFNRGAAQALGLTGLLTAAALGGVMEAVARKGDSIDPTVASVMEGTIATSALLASAEGVPEMTAGVGPDWDLPNLDHERVDYWVEKFTTSKRGEFSRFLSRSGRYVPMISAKLEERGMPQDLIYLAMIESGFNPKAYSPAHASGLWQFISETGRRYGLDINQAVDERNDPVKATDAALDYITYLHNRFGSWYLAAAGYNSGENRVGRIMREVTGSERGDEYSYYRIWDRLPRETRDYVPLMVAAARIAKDPARYGFDDVEIAEPLHFDEVMVDPATPLSVVAEAAGSTVAELRELNPHFKLNRTRNDMPSAVRVPSGRAEQFASNWVDAKQKIAKARVEEAPKTRTYRVRNGDNLTVIARRHGVTINQLRRANGMRSDFVRAGSVLKVPA
jgi:membrane-bound lytic murein transglycosylase D